MNIHYNSLLDNYHHNWFYKEDSAYEQWQVALVRNSFEKDLNPTECNLLDLGSGTCRFAMLLHKSMKLHKPITCVDNSRLLNKCKGTQIIKIIPRDIVEFLAENNGLNMYDLILAKEVIHHLHHQSVSVYRNIFDSLHIGGKFLIITRPKFDINYPFPEKAIKIWQKTQPSIEEITQKIYESGFTKVIVRTHTFPVTISVTEWSQMLRNRFWSIFADFADQEIEEFIKTLKSNITFEEKLIFIESQK